MRRGGLAIVAPRKLERGDGVTALAGWENFYVIVGSSAGALIGLQFVVLTLIAESPIVSGRDVKRASSAFSTPTIVHFGAVLLLSAIISAPWHGLGAVAVLWGAVGFCGIVYEIIVARRMRMQTAYQPEFEDWLFHALLPMAAYATVIGAAIAARAEVDGALFGIAAAALLLLFVGIHNAWDAVTYHVFTSNRKRSETEER
jgi:hypothetical protein